ncbi:nuclear transport factor 2 family protein [Kribbella sp. NBC_00889]|nr:nuclear transport factor 2 family protein [Kribbella sp. NBC_00889]
MARARRPRTGLRQPQPVRRDHPFNGQSTVLVDGNQASGECYTIAHHATIGDDGRRTLMVASMRYLDQYVKQQGSWHFAERRLLVDWTETRFDRWTE